MVDKGTKIELTLEEFSKLTMHFYDLIENSNDRKVNPTLLREMQKGLLQDLLAEGYETKLKKAALMFDLNVLLHGD